jgi:organic hydroperoxide reductase OsmC/OhrA
MSREHIYRAKIRWTGNSDSGTSSYKAYERSYTLSAPGKPDILCTADPLFRGDRAKWNPEEMLVASISGCHQLWYLHLCADAGVNVRAYEDDPQGVMTERSDGSGEFTRVTLWPRVTVIDLAKRDLALKLHETAHEKCFIARSMNFKVEVRATIL